MKPFLGIDRTTDKKNEIVNGDEFITKKPSVALSDAWEQASDNVENVIDKAKLSLPARIFGWICIIVTVLAVGAIGTLWSEEDIALTTLYQTIPWVFWIGMIALIGAIVFGVSANRHFKKTLESDEGEVAFSAVDSASDSVFAELGVPSDAFEIDLLSAGYRLKNGEPVHYEPWLPTHYYTTLIFSAYREGNALCLTNGDGVHTFPLSALRKIQTVKKSIVTDAWNKDEPHNKGVYKPYKIREDEDGNYISKPYYILTLEYAGEEWGIYFPCYELPAIEDLTGLTAESV